MTYQEILLARNNFLGPATPLKQGLALFPHHMDHGYISDIKMAKIHAQLVPSCQIPSN